MTELWVYPKASVPVRKGDRYFQLHNTGLQNQDVLFVKDEPTLEGRVLLDPNTLSEDGTVALNTWAVSQDANWQAYALSASGSDWLTWRVRDVSSGEDLPDEIKWSKFSGAAWKKDGNYLILSVWLGTDRRNRVFYQNLQANAPFVELIPHLEAAYHFVGNDDARFYFKTDLAAARARLIAMDTRNPGRENR
jgi:prolyl oligopeptidase PreP (S9A serine peptidase family)